MEYSPSRDVTWANHEKDLATNLCSKDQLIPTSNDVICAKRAKHTAGMDGLCSGLLMSFE